MPANRIWRGRRVQQVFADGDPVVKPGVSPAVWRAGVIRAEAGRVQVEYLDGTCEWFDEDQLVHADRADAGPVAS